MPVTRKRAGGAARLPSPDSQRAYHYCPSSAASSKQSPTRHVKEEQGSERDADARRPSSTLSTEAASRGSRERVLRSELLAEGT